MPRHPRIQLVKEPLHVVQRGHNHNNCFIDRDDYFYYLDCLKESSQKYSVQLHAYVLMPNHVQMLLTPIEHDGVSKMMQSIGRRYVQHFNHRYECYGTLWEGRFKSCLVDRDNYLFSCHRYIESNPVRKGLTSKAEKYEWSSHHFNANGRYDPIITPHTKYLDLAETDNERQQNYRTLFSKQMHNNELEFIRSSLNSNGVLGDDNFILFIERSTNIRLEKGKAGRPPKNGE